MTKLNFANLFQTFISNLDIKNTNKESKNQNVSLCSTKIDQEIDLKIKMTHPQINPNKK